jgi:Amt family ammonium transporter
MATGWRYGNRHQFFIQLFAALTIIVWDAVVTFIILMVLKFLFKGLRMSDEELEIGDVAIHDEEAYPADEGYTRVGELVGASTGGGSPPERSPTTASIPGLGGDPQ